jgi:signal transduction histidine kinase
MRGVAPAAVLALVVAAAAAAISFASYSATQSPAVLLACAAAFLVLGLGASRTQAIACGSAGFGLVALMLSNAPGGLSTSAVAFAAALAFAPVAGGQVICDRGRRVSELAAQARRLERAREDDQRIAVVEERARIAAELQDVIGRAVDLMTTEADAARAVAVERPADACAHVEAVERTGREALAETRRLLGLLRRDMTEEPA